MGPVICRNKTFNTITASLNLHSHSQEHYVLRHTILKNFPDAEANPKKLTWKLYAMNLKAMVCSHGVDGAKELMEEKFRYQPAEAHSSLAGLYQSIRYLRHQCTQENVCASDLYKNLGNVLNAAAHEIAINEVKKAGIPWE